MNVAFFSEMSRIEGSAYHMLRQAKWMIEHGHGAIVMSSGGPLEEEYARLGIPFVRTPSTEQNVALGMEQLVADGSTIARACSEYRIDAILAAPKLPFAVACAAVGDTVPVYLNVLSSRYFVPQTPRTIDEVQRAAREGRIISTTIDDVVPHAVMFGFDPEQALLAPVPIDATHTVRTKDRAEMRADLGIAADDVLIFTACRLDDDREPFIVPLANAVARLKASGRKVRLAIAGDGTAAARIRAGAPPETMFLGVRRDLANIFAATDIFCGEGSIIGDAALEHLPVVITCALNLPKQGDRAFSIFGLTSLDHLFWSSTKLVPPVSFEEALLPLVDDPALRKSLGEAAFETVEHYFSIDRYMQWFLDVAGGKNPGTLLPVQRARAVVATAGGSEDGLDEAAAIAAALGDDQLLGLELAMDVPWQRALALPIESLRALVRASRRLIPAGVPRITIESQTAQFSGDVDPALAERIAQIVGDLPPTSDEPRVQFSRPKRYVHLVLSGNKEPAFEKVFDVASLGPEDGLVLWAPRSLRDAACAQRIQQLAQLTKAEILYIDQPVPWTLVGRLFAVATAYTDDGDLQFTRYRELARSRNISLRDEVPV